MAKGSHYIQAIDLLLDSELHTQQQMRDDQVAMEIIHLVAPYDIDPRSRRLSGAFKAAKTITEAQTEIRESQIFKDRFPQLAKLPETELRMFINQLKKAMSKFDMALYKERTKLSTISTIVRPLTTKWLERWKTQRQDDFDYEKSVYRVELLLNREIENEDQYRKWMEDVYDLFSELVIFRGPALGQKSDLRVPKPMGMVSESNERVYRRNWTEFRDLYGRRLIDRAEEIAGGRFDAAYNSSYRPQLKSSEYSPNYMQSAGFNQGFRDEYIEQPKVTEAKGSFPTYTVKFESAELGQGEATKVWTSKQALKGEIARFIDLVASTWGPAGKLVHATFTFDTQQGESSIRIPNKTPDEAAEAVIQLLELAD
jgi:hypothetical protein